MMAVYPGDLRVVRFVNRSEVFVPASEAQIVSFYRALERDLPQRFVPMIDVLGEAFPQVALAFRQIGLTEPEARIGAVLDEYESEPDALVRQICSLTGVCDLRLTFRARTDLEGFLRAYEMQLTNAEIV
jgi:hypothetical protein